MSQKEIDKLGHWIQGIFTKPVAHLPDLKGKDIRPFLQIETIVDKLITSLMIIK